MSPRNETATGQVAYINARLLDPATGLEVFRMLRELQRRRPFALVLATHSERLARGCHRLARLLDGKLTALDERGSRAYFDGLGA